MMAGAGRPFRGSSNHSALLMKKGKVALAPYRTVSILAVTGRFQKGADSDIDGFGSFRYWWPVRGGWVHLRSSNTERSSGSYLKAGIPGTRLDIPPFFRSVQVDRFAGSRSSNPVRAASTSRVSRGRRNSIGITEQELRGGPSRYPRPRCGFLISCRIRHRGRYRLLQPCR